MVGRRVVGLAPSKNARLLLWGTAFGGRPDGFRQRHEALNACRNPFAEAGYPLDVHVAVRGELGDEGRWSRPRPSRKRAA
jgi:hypothetical protein